MQTAKTARIWAILNLIGATVMITANSLANALPINGFNTGEISAFYPNLFVPAGITFSVWGLIYLLVIGFVVHGLIVSFKANEANHIKISSAGPWFFISCIGNIGWIFAWHYLMLPLSLLFMIVILISLIILYQKLEQDPFPRSFPEKLTLRWPFSMYLGWITIATVANVTAILVDIKWNRFGMSEDFWLTLMLVVAVLISAMFIIRKRDTVFAWVILWALAGIVMKRTTENKTDLNGYYSAVAGIIVIAFLGGIMAFKKSKQPNL